jgi:hypothetical protein
MSFNSQENQDDNNNDNSNKSSVPVSQFGVGSTNFWAANKILRVVLQVLHFPLLIRSRTFTTFY